MHNILFLSFISLIVLLPLLVTQNNPFTRIIPPTPNSLSCPLSPSPGASRVPPSGTLTIPDSTNISGVAVSEIADQEPVVARVADSVLVILSEGFNEIDDMFSKLAARVNMPFHQVSDRYLRLYSHGHGGNIWNTYLMYFMKNMDQELARLPKGEEITGTPTTDARKCCYTLFKEEYKDKYAVILEKWKEAKEIENIGGTIAQQQQLFDETKKHLNHMVHHYLFAGRLLI